MQWSRSFDTEDWILRETGEHGVIAEVLSEEQFAQTLLFQALEENASPADEPLYLPITAFETPDRAKMLGDDVESPSGTSPAAMPSSTITTGQFTSRSESQASKIRNGPEQLHAEGVTAEEDFDLETALRDVDRRREEELTLTYEIEDRYKRAEQRLRCRRKFSAETWRLKKRAEMNRLKRRVEELTEGNRRLKAMIAQLLRSNGRVR